MRIFNAFTNAIGKNIKVDLDIYHCEPEVFKNILEKKKNQYDYLVIMPHFRNENLKNVGCPEDVLNTLTKIPVQKLILLDKEIKRISKGVGRVYQDFTDYWMKFLIVWNYKKEIYISPFKNLI